MGIRLCDQTFSNQAVITINDASLTTPYPSDILVGSMSGTITKVTVTIHDLSHAYLQDLEILLVGPGGENVILMDDVGNFYPGVANATYTFDDDASDSIDPNTIPDPGPYKPSNDGSLENLPVPAPQQPPAYGTALSVFNGTNPNGVWSLYVNDDESPDAGSIAGGWSLHITTDCA